MDIDPHGTHRTIHVFGQTLQICNETTEKSVIRFLEKVDTQTHADTQCWLWTGTRTGLGYGIFYYESKYAMAHRAGYHMFVGPVDPALHLHHRTEEPICCIGPSCVNPAHMLPVTPAVHVHQFTPTNITAIRGQDTKCPRGHDLTGENLIIRPDGRRRCRECRNYWSRTAAKANRPAKPVSTTCKNGHDLNDPANVYEYMGLRYCRPCHSALTLRQAREKAAARTGPRFCKNGHELDPNRSGSTCPRCASEVTAARWAKERESRMVDGVVYCKNGHPQNEENVVEYVILGKPRKFCKGCSKMHGRLAYERRKAKYGKTSASGATS